MENCTIYSHYPSFEKIEKLLRESFPDDDIKTSEQGHMRKQEEHSKLISVAVSGGLFSPKKTLTLNYRERATPSYTLDRVDCALSGNLAGMNNFISAIATPRSQIKYLLMQKVSTINCEIACIAEPGFTDDFKLAIQRIARELDAILFVQPGKTFSESRVQHFLNADFRLILDVQGYSNVDTLDVKIDPKYFDAQQPATPDQLERKRISEAYLQEHGVAVNAHLPPVSDEASVVLRDKTELLERAYALTLIAAKGDGLEQPYLDKAKSNFGIEGLSPLETLIYNKPTLDGHEKTYASWRYESLTTILWSLGLLESLPYPSRICDVEHIIGIVLQNSRENLAAMAAVRSKAEILQELDKIYRMDWACVDARIKNQPITGDLQPDVVYERHYALNWITKYGDQSWDNVSTNT